VLIFYSGNGGTRANPEHTLGRKANIMLTYATYHKSGKPDKRFGRIAKARKTGKPVKVED